MDQQLIPPQFLFRFRVACAYEPKMPLGSGHAVDLGKGCRVPFFSAMEGKPEFAELRMAWNEFGLGVMWQNSG